MSTKRKCLDLTKNYLKKLHKDALTAFSIGYADGEEGKKMALPSLPASSKGLPYAAQLLAIELYKEGYKVGKNR